MGGGQDTDETSFAGDGMEEGSGEIGTGDWVECLTLPGLDWYQNFCFLFSKSCRLIRRVDPYSLQPVLLLSSTLIFVYYSRNGLFQHLDSPFAFQFFSQRRCQLLVHGRQNSLLTNSSI